MSQLPLGSAARPIRVAIVGSGPSAFYAAEALFKVGDLHCRVDMFDRLPTPFGLVRGGVAPDHQKIKSVVKVYDKIASQEGFRFFGNVMLGRDIQVADLRAHYDQIVYAVGNEGSRRLGIPGEDQPRVHSATEFVYWYNGHPDYQHLTFDLENVLRVAVVGNGNVAMDVTRILIQDPERLATTDIADGALEVLRKSAVREVVLLGRRGPAQAAYSPKEMAEIAALEEVDVAATPDDATIDPVSQTWLDSGKAPKSAAKNAAFLADCAARGGHQGERVVRCRFRVSPVEVLGDGGVTGVRIQHAELQPDAHGVPRPKAIDSFEEIEVDMLLSAIGYRGQPIPGVPFDDGWGTIPNDHGRVLDSRDGAVVANEYVVGWAKRGPSGLIGTNSPDSKATVAQMVQDLAGRMDAADERPDVTSELEAQGVAFSTFEDWRRYDAWEKAEGEQTGRVRRKLTSVDAILEQMRKLR